MSSNDSSNGRDRITLEIICVIVLQYCCHWRSAKLPIFFTAKDLSNLPPFGPKDFDVFKMLQEVDALSCSVIVKSRLSIS